MKMKKENDYNKMANLTAPLAVMILGLFIAISGFINLIIGSSKAEVEGIMKWIALGLFILAGLIIVGCIIWFVVIFSKYQKK